MTQYKRLTYSLSKPLQISSNDDRLLQNLAQEHETREIFNFLDVEMTYDSHGSI